MKKCLTAILILCAIALCSSCSKSDSSKMCKCIGVTSTIDGGQRTIEMDIPSGGSKCSDIDYSGSSDIAFLSVTCVDK
ncbi:MAG: hypothetical protein KBT27_07250 [Prevotellaceae bacterium]|nr:hypothetical protein [Candidatus Faecinaster equi]